MSFLTAQYPSLLGGVSQQAEHNRLPGQAHVLENAIMFPADGLGKRPPTEFMGLIADNGTSQFQVVTDGYKPHISYLDYSPTEKFMLAINRGASPTYSPIATVNAYDGKSYPVSFIGGCENYLQGVDDSANKLKSVTVQNTTFILNTEKVVGAVGTSSAALTNRAMLFCKQGAYSSTYTVKIVINDGGTDRTATATCKTWNGTDTVAVTNAAGELRSIKTDEILGATSVTAYTLWANLITACTASSINTIGANSLTIIKNSGDSVLLLYCNGTYTIKEITCTDSLGNSALIGLWSKTPSISNLPQIADHNFKIKITNNTAEDEDDYWVIFQRDALAAGSGMQKGQWYETIAPSTPAVFDQTTLPLKMVPIRNGAGVIQTFEISYITWTNRLVGDTTSNADPSFIGQTISELGFFRDRLIFASNYSLIASEAGNYYNFFRSTVRNYVDSEIIDIDISYNKDFIIRWLVPFEDSLFIFSDKVIHQLTAEPIFSAQYASAAPLFELNIYPYCKPTIVGKTCIFATDNGSYLHFRELYRISDQAFDTTLITAQVPAYIPKTPCTISGNPSMELVVIGNGGDAYVYKYAWNGSEKTQSAWCKWTSTDSTWDAVGFFDNFVYLYSRPDFHTGAHYAALVERIILGDGLVEGGFFYNIHLDRRITQAQASIALVGGNTQISVPHYPYYGTGGTAMDVYRYSSVAGISVISTLISVVAYNPGGATTPAPGGTHINMSGAFALRITISGDHTTTTMRLGFPYRFLNQFGEVNIMEKSQGGGLKPILGGRCQLRYANFHVNKTKSFKVNLNTTTTATSPTTDFDFAYPAAAPQSPIDLNYGLSTDSTFTGPVRCAIFKHNQKVRVSLINDSIYPSFFTGVEWELFLNVRGGRYPM